ncbi:hypothetical protein BH10PAT3_BH10PAT3_8030 [soil metagenome]
MGMSRRARAWFGVVVTGFLVLLLSTFSLNVASAAQITVRSLTLQPGVSDAGSKPSGSVNHLFTFTPPTTASIGSIQFLYCASAGGACVTPSGLTTTSATMGTQTGATGFTLVNTTNGSPYITRSAASMGGSAVSYQLLAVTNPSATNTAFYVRITTFTSANATTGSTDTGTVAASTATQIVLTGTMPESLIFCTGGTISTTSGIPDCTTATSGAISFNQLFSPTAAATASSQIAASTNSLSGYVITVNGVTMTSGSTTIPALGSATVPAVGNSQFGMNLMANTTAVSTPAVGAAVAAAPNGTTLRGQPQTGYNTADTFKFVSGDTVAASNNTVAGPTNSQIYTASYIVNVAGGQLAGTYTTTLTYICTSTF